jgi:uncharacterized protein YyaL (SSP411 family)
MVRSGKQPSHPYNHLIQEKSPYLLQHADNPVDWYPWNEKAFRRAKEEDKPIFLSIGYATCHWCHVMAHESFEDAEVARLLNQSFVSIKVDREERPDIDQVYMSVCQALTGQGGWPLSIFMTPEGNPFFAGTYFPKDSRAGMVGFTVLLTRISTLWQNDREKRVHPLKDDKIITSWNGLMIAALAKGAQALQDDGYAWAARRAADFLLEKMRTSHGRLYRRYRHGHIAYPGFLDDYAYLVWGLIELYEATFEVRYLEKAVHLNQIMIELFGDAEKGGFYFTGQENEMLIARPKEIYDGAVPSGNSVAALNLLRLARMTGKVIWEKKADQLLQVFSSAVADVPMACTQLLIALDFVVGPTKEMVIAGDPQEEMARAMIALLHRKFVPNKAVLLRQEGEAGKDLTALSPFVAGMIPVGKKPAVYLCARFACRSPLTDLPALESALE